MEYNTVRPQLKISDYGRNVYKLIQHAKSVEDRDKRNQMAEAIVDIMVHISQDPKESPDYKRKYWVHLMIMADWELDIDLPYDITPEESVRFTPLQLKYSQGKMRYRHYGSVMERMIHRVAEYPEGEERDRLVELAAHAMKRDYLVYNRDTVEDDIISLQLAAISGDKLHVPGDFQYMDAREYLKGMEEEHHPVGSRKKRKKKKKNH